MKLENIKYSQFDGQPKEWKLDLLELDDTNLLVGKNASGKSKTLNLINNIAHLLSGEQPAVFSSGAFDITFDLDGQKLRYYLNCDNAKVTKEEFEEGGRKLLERGAGGIGRIWAQKQSAFIEFQAPENQLAAITRRDTIQHPFFEDLYNWGKSVHYFPFGSALGKDKYAIFVANTAAKKPEPKGPDAVVAIFRRGTQEIGDRFVNSVVQGMRQIGYPVKSVTISNPISINISIEGMMGITPALEKDLSCICVQEEGLNTITDQNEMSQGMFRALSIIIQITYAEMASHPSCIVIDDIGEGLDFERASTLIELLIQRANKSRIQLIMATNDRFIMNKVPLKAWTVLHRDRSHIHVFNYKNSKDLFDQFETTGLSNFDFFSLDFVKQKADTR